MFGFARKKAPSPLAASVSSAGNEARIQQLGVELLERSARHEKGLFSAKFYSDKLVDWAMKDENFKTQLFRFVDVFPVLKNPDLVYTHIADYLLRDNVKRPPGFDLGMKLGGVAKGLMTSTMSSQITGMAKQFIAGENAAGAIKQLRKQWDGDVAFSVDLLGEVCVGDHEADVYARRYVEVLDVLARETASWPAKPLLETDHIGRVPRVNISIKLSSLSARFNPLDPEATIADVRRRVGPLLARAADQGAFVNFDIESSTYKDVTIAAFKQLMLEHAVDGGIALQAYLRSGENDARDLAQWAKTNNRVVTVRLVKGAYWDYETIHAEMMGWPSPVWAVKRETDACFERMADIFLDATPRQAEQGGIKLALGSHNLRSIAAVLAGLEKRGLPNKAVELQMLYGMADPMKAAAVESGLRVRNYVPLGEMLPGMAYLVRRLLENTSNESWLRGSMIDKTGAEKLFASPHGKTSSGTYDAAGQATLHRLSDAVENVGDGRPFLNEPLRDFSLRATRESFATCLIDAQTNVAGGFGEPVGEEDASSAVALAHDAFAAWRDTSALVRAGMVVRAATLLRERRDELAALVVAESGKTWTDADADVCEAIDFCEYYAREAPRLFTPQRLGKFVGELNETFYQPRGVAVVIAPWNFPLAILCGMTAAALVTGNTVVMKPAEQTPRIARALHDIFKSTGIPENACVYIEGPGEKVGAALVRDPRVALIAFTGSKAVGFDILKTAGDTREEQAEVKRVVCEMGGKNAIIVDASADPDEAVLGVRQSAFGFQGQKCSACSRVIVVDPTNEPDGAYQTFVRRLADAVQALVVGDPTSPGTQVGPVIDAEAKTKIERYIEIGKQTARVAATLAIPDGLEVRTNRPYVAPHVFADVTPDSPLWTDEIFGPVVAVTRAASFDEALRLANASKYKLTGGVFSRTPAHLEKARREFRVGNLYLNRGITGALVGRQPFGGFGHSGVGSKAGGRDYLLQFVEPRAVCENTLRRGFAPATGSADAAQGTPGE